MTFTGKLPLRAEAEGRMAAEGAAQEGTGRLPLAGKDYGTSVRQNSPISML